MTGYSKRSAHMSILVRSSIFLMDNEIYFNSSDRVYHTDLVLGQDGLPLWMNRTNIPEEAVEELWR